MSRSSEALMAAQRHLEAGRSCVSHNQMGLAVSEAYFSMYNAVLHAATEDDPPSTHRGVDHFFYWQLVQAGSLSNEQHKSYFDDAREERIRWHYEGKDPLRSTEVEGIFRAAEELLDHVS